MAIDNEARDRSLAETQKLGPNRTAPMARPQQYPHGISDRYDDELLCRITNAQKQLQLQISYTRKLAEEIRRLAVERTEAYETLRASIEQARQSVRDDYDQAKAMVAGCELTCDERAVNNAIADLTTFCTDFITETNDDMEHLVAQSRRMSSFCAFLTDFHERLGTNGYPTADEIDAMEAERKKRLKEMQSHLIEAASDVAASYDVRGSKFGRRLNQFYDGVLEMWVAHQTFSEKTRNLTRSFLETSHYQADIVARHATILGEAAFQFGTFVENGTFGDLSKMSDTASVAVRHVLGVQPNGGTPRHLRH